MNRTTTAAALALFLRGGVPCRDGAGTGTGKARGHRTGSSRPFPWARRLRRGERATSATTTSQAQTRPTTTFTGSSAGTPARLSVSGYLGWASPARSAARPSRPYRPTRWSSGRAS